MLGMGTTVRNVHESVLVCRPKDGRAPERVSKDVPSVFAAPMLADIDGILGMTTEAGELRRGMSAFVHSAKPDAFYTSIVPRLYPGPYVEMFSRRTRPGWTQAHSNEDRKLDECARIFREVWPRRTAEERLAAARRR
jgi:N6-adenosine-specific RNA methylase IME4